MQPVIEKVGLTEYRERYDELMVSCFLYLAVSIYFNLLRDEKVINVTSSRRYFFFTRAKFDANNGLFKENLVKYKGERTSQDVMFIVFSSLIAKYTVYLAVSIVFYPLIAKL